MNSKMKSFKKSIFGADIRQLWIFSLLYGIIIFFGTFFDFYLDNEPYGNAIPYSFVNSRFFEYSCLSNFFGLCAGAVLALRLFAYLYSTNAISFYHGLPFKRKSIFISKILSGAVLLTAPVLINFAIVGITKLCGSYIQIRWFGLIYWLANQVIYSLLAFSFVTFGVMLSGNILALLATCILLSIAPLTIIGFIHTVCQNYLLGYAYDPTNFFSFIYITPDVLLFKARGIIYIIAIPILFIISYFMYKKRDLERCGEAVVFPKLKIAFIYFAGLLGGIFSYFYFSIWNFKTLLFMLPFGIIAVIIANMINRRSVTLKGAFSHTVIFTVLVLCFLGAFRFDIIGFEKRVPLPQNIESVTVLPDRYYAYRNADNFEKLAITDKEDIEKVRAYHIINTASHLQDTESMPNYLKISYKLKNGRTLTRGYCTDYLSERDRDFEAVSNIEQVKKSVYPIYKNDNLEIVNINLNNFLASSMIYPDNPIADKLIEAMNEDIANLSYEENAVRWHNVRDCVAPLDVNIEYKNPDNEKKYSEGCSFPISFGFTRTMDLLKEYGYYDRFMTVNNIASVGIDKNNDNQGNLKLNDFIVDEIIDDPEKMQEILYTYQTSYKNPIRYDGTKVIYDEYIFLSKFGYICPFAQIQQ